MTVPTTIAPSTTDYVARLADADPADMLAKVQRAFDEARTPPGLRERFQAFAEAEADHVLRLDAALLGEMAWWLTAGAETGHDRDVLDQVCLQSAQSAIAIIARAMKERQGQPFDPARLAIVAFTIAHDIAAAPDFKEARLPLGLMFVCRGESDLPTIVGAYV